MHCVFGDDLPDIFAKSLGGWTRSGINVCNVAVLQAAIVTCTVSLNAASFTCFYSGALSDTLLIFASEVEKDGGASQLRAAAIVGARLGSAQRVHEYHTRTQAAGTRSGFALSSDPSQ